MMKHYVKLACFVGGALFGSAGVKLLASKDAKKAYTHITAAGLRMKDSVMETVTSVQENAADILAAVEADAQKRYPKAHVKLTDKIRDGGVWADQGVIAGCAGGLFDNITEAADILRGGSTGNGAFTLDIYPTSVPVSLELTKIGATADLLETGAVIKPSFCGPCFGAGDVPANGALSIRHTTRNFPSREGSKPGSGQLAGVALMDARSIAATTANGGILTPATEVDYDPTVPEYHYDPSSYEARVYQGFGHGDYDALLKLGPNIKDWPEIAPLGDNLLLKGGLLQSPTPSPPRTSSSPRVRPLPTAPTPWVWPSSPSAARTPPMWGAPRPCRPRKPPVRAGQGDAALLAKIRAVPGCEALTWDDVQLASTIFAVKPGDGSAREQAASCQRVLGGAANFACEYATKRYRSNCINWGMLPFLVENPGALDNGDYVYLPGVRKALLEAADELDAVAVKPDGGLVKFTVKLGAMTDAERRILADGCLINYYKNN